jgi:nucleoside-diphosphate-sugar epimerase
VDDFRGRRALVLGGMGFIGSNLALRLVDLGADVTVVDSMLPQYGGNEENVAPARDRLRVNFSDIRDRHSLDFLVKGMDFVFSVAGQTSHIESMTDPMTDLDINCRSQLSILESCRAHNKGAVVVYASTRQLYGRPLYLPVDEKHPVVPVDVNGINKLAAEMYYSLYTEVHGMRCVSLRLTNTYGPRQHLSGNKQGFVGIFIRQAISGELVRIFGDGTQVRDFNYIDDVVDAFLLAATREELRGGVFNLGAPDPCSILDFVALLREHATFETEIVPFPPQLKAIDIGDYYSDYSLFRSRTGWEPRVPLREGLSRTVEYFRPRASLYW